jgi:malate/lactate dehydrogenase
MAAGMVALKFPALQHAKIVGQPSRDWMKTKHQKCQDRIVELGWDVIACLGQMDDLKRREL